MPWLNDNLASVMGDTAAKANAAIATAQKALNNLNSQTAALKAKAETAINAVTNNKSMLDKMAESGLYMITLDPQVGAWTTRLTNALNAPPNSGYCTGTANLILSADPDVVVKAYGKLKDALKKEVDDAGKFIDQTDFSEFLPDETDFEDVPLIEAPDWDTTFTFNEWKSATLGDVFGGAMAGLGSASGKLNKGAKSLLDQANHVGKAAAALNTGLNSAKKFITELQATGVYSIMLEPGAGGYLYRLQSEAGAPPADPQMYCAGFVCIATAGGISELAGKYDTISKLMKG